MADEPCSEREGCTAAGRTAAPADSACGPAAGSAPPAASAAAPTSVRRRRLRVALVYTGGLLGPLGGGIVSPMLLRIGASLHASAGAVAASLTAYFVPFAAAQLVSGTLGERWGRRRTVRVAYLGYAAGAVACALAPNLPLFLAMRAVLGTANAFTSPLLLAGLADMLPPQRLSRSVGVYASCQAAGQSFAPLVGGLAATTSWRLGFAAVAVTAGLLALAPPPGEPRPGAAGPRWRPLAGAHMAWLSLAAFASYVGAAALPFLVALYAEKQLHQDSGVTGAILLGFGLAGLALGALWGTATDRFGARRCGAAAAVLTAGAVASVGTTGSTVALALCWTAAGVGASMLTVALQNLTVRAVPGNRGGALSAVSAFRFSGAAVAPLIWLPLYYRSPGLSFAAAASTVLLVAVAMPFVRLPGAGGRPGRAGA